MPWGKRLLGHRNAQNTVLHYVTGAVHDAPSSSFEVLPNHPGADSILFPENWLQIKNIQEYEEGKE